MRAVGARAPGANARIAPSRARFVARTSAGAGLLPALIGLVRRPGRTCTHRPLAPTHHAEVRNDGWYMQAVRTSEGNGGWESRARRGVTQRAAKHPGVVEGP